MLSQEIKHNVKSHWGCQFTRLVLLSLLGLLVVSCASRTKGPVYSKIEHAENLPEPNVKITIPGLTDCTDSGETEVGLNDREPVTILVHGCYASAGRYRALAGVFALHGQQTLCYTYDDRESLKESASKLVGALNTLAKKMPKSKIQVIGHSQGGLIARHALTDNSSVELADSLTNIRLATISAPFSGIEVSAHCGSLTLGILSLGLTKLICFAVAGSKYREIPPSSDFINEPGVIVPNVSDHLMIVTDETGSCREKTRGHRCKKDDFVFSLQEQRQEKIEKDPRVLVSKIRSGHVEIVGTATAVPFKLIKSLQKNKILRHTPKKREARFHRYLKKMFVKL